MNKILIINLVLVFTTFTSVNSDLLYYFNNPVEKRPHNIAINRDGPVPFNIYFNDESKSTIKDYLDAFAFEVKERPNETGYIISYAGRRAKVNESLNNLKNIKNYLTKKKKIKEQRLVFMDGGFLERGMTYFYFVPEGALPPKPSPTLLPSEVVIIKKNKN